MPFVTRDLLESIIAHVDSGTDAVVAVHTPGGRLEPLCAWYGQGCAPAIESAWDSGDRSLHGMLSRVNTRAIPIERLVALADADRLFLNVNTAADLERARALAAMAAGDGVRSES
jgi:molybdopterin-guanine dinucleotide biosynthesis protein A